MKDSRLKLGRYLFDGGKFGTHSYYEAEILEVSPLGKHIKLRYQSGEELWKDSNIKLDIVEELDKEVSK